MPSTNHQLAAIFSQMADLTEITGGNRFKVNAFTKVSRILEDLTKDVATIDPQLLPKLEGIGQGTADRIAQYLDAGEIADHQALLAAVPPGLMQVMDVPGLGPKTVAQLWHEADVTSLADLKAKLDTGELAELKGFGKKKIENLQKNLKFAETAGQRRRIGHAYALAQTLIQDLRADDTLKIDRIETAGSLRRGKETIGDLDLLVTTPGGDANRTAVLDAFVKHPLVDDILVHGDTKASIRTTQEAGGMQVDLRVVDPAHFGATLMYFTGSKAHNIKLRERALDRGLSLNEYALTRDNKDGPAVAAQTEEEVYAAGPYVDTPRTTRRPRGNHAGPALPRRPRRRRRAAAIIRTLRHPRRAAFPHHRLRRHVVDRRKRPHALARGFHTVAITDHSKGQVQANGLSNERLIQHIEAVREVAQKLKGQITVLAGSEVDILSDGRLDYPDELLAELDIVVASPHAALTQDPDKATKRLLKAIDNPYVTLIGHPTGRLVNRREGLSPDMDALFKAAAVRGIALEINASPYRLDLRDTHAHTWVHDHGGKLSINTDAHQESNLDNLRFGVLTARRAGARKQDVVNCLNQKKLRAWIRSTRL